MVTETKQPVVNKLSIQVVAPAVFMILTIGAYLLHLYCARNGNIPRYMEMASLYAVTILSIVTIITGIVALLMTLLGGKQMKNCKIAIASAVFGLIILSILVPELIFTKKMNDTFKCMKKLQRLGEEIKVYASNHDGNLPVADNWCDLLMENNKNLSRDDFRCPASPKGTCSYKFNRNLSGVRLVDIPSSVVVLYESEEGWNYSGIGESLSTRHDGGCNALFIGNSVTLFHSGILDGLMDSSYWVIGDTDKKSSSQ